MSSHSSSDHSVSPTISALSPHTADATSMRNLAPTSLPPDTMMLDPMNVDSSFSKTPPPSQVPLDRPKIASLYRAGTPTLSGLSSPPPTVPIGNENQNSLSYNLQKPSAQELASASKEELVALLGTALAEQDRLDVAAKEARMSAAHHKLQHNLLTIETEEASKRMEVEHEMTRREVALLQHATQDRLEPPTQDFLTKIRAYCESLEEDNTQLLRRLKQAKKLMESQEDEIERLKEKNLQFKQRIRENREHLNTLRSPGGIFHSASPNMSSHSYPATPQQYRITPKQTPVTARSARQVRTHSQEPFAALLLADRVLSQENNSEPSTPVLPRRTELPTTPASRHNRAVQSLSFTPNTPQTARSGTAHSTLLPSVQFTPNTDRAARQRLAPAQSSRERRRKSRDSTISASDTEELARAAAGEYHTGDEVVHESQASQSATEMLRVDPRESFEVAASRTHTPTPITDKSSLLQSKILGPVSKPAAEKRKHAADNYNRETSAKKARADGTVGLGIGFTPVRS